MNAFRTMAVITKGQELHLSSLPFDEGRKVEVIILADEVGSPTGKRHPLRGKPLTYENPFEPIAQSDWEAIK